MEVAKCEYCWPNNGTHEKGCPERCSGAKKERSKADWAEGNTKARLGGTMPEGVSDSYKLGFREGVMDDKNQKPSDASAEMGDLFADFDDAYLDARPKQQY